MKDIKDLRARTKLAIILGLKPRSCVARMCDFLEKAICLNPYAYQYDKFCISKCTSCPYPWDVT